MCLISFLIYAISEMNIFAMRLGKGKHLKGLTLMGGVITPEEYDHFHEVSNMVLLFLMCTHIP